jgi:hypothetical protein
MAFPKIDIEEEVQEMLDDGQTLGFGDIHSVKAFAAYIRDNVGKEIEDWFAP